MLYYSNYYALPEETLIITLVVGAIINILMTLWVYKDATHHAMNAPGWAMAVCFCGCIGCVVYLIARANNPNGQFGYGYRPQQPGYYQQQGIYGPNTPNQQNPQYQGGRPMQGQPYTQYPQYQGGRPGYGQPPSQYPTFRGGQPDTEPNTTFDAQNIGGTPSPSSATIMPNRGINLNTQPRKQCKACGAETDAIARFCPVCGSNQFNQ